MNIQTTPPLTTEDYKGKLSIINVVPHPLLNYLTLERRLRIKYNSLFLKKEGETSNTQLNINYPVEREENIALKSENPLRIYNLSYFKEQNRRANKHG